MLQQGNGTLIGDIASQAIDGLIGALSRATDAPLGVSSWLLALAISSAGVASVKSRAEAGRAARLRLLRSWSASLRHHTIGLGLGGRGQAKMNLLAHGRGFLRLAQRSKSAEPAISRSRRRGIGVGLPRCVRAAQTKGGCFQDGEHAGAARIVEPGGRSGGVDG